MLPDATAVSHILTQAGVRDAEVSETTLGIVCRLEPSAVLTGLEALKGSELDFRVLVDFLGADTGEHIEITYHLRSIARDEEIYVKTDVAYDGELRSVWNIYASALMPERETAELLGFALDGHPNPKRLLTTDGVDPLLRKAVAIRTVEEVRNR